MKSILNLVSSTINKPLIALTGIKIDATDFTHQHVTLISQFDSEEEIDKVFPKQTVTNEILALNKMCTICRENFCLNDKFRFTSNACPCERLYHTKCIDLWFQINASCPHCRRQYIIPKKPVLIEMFDTLKHITHKKPKTSQTSNLTSVDRNINTYGSSKDVKTTNSYCFKSLPSNN